MTGRNYFFAISLVCGLSIVAGCSKESPVIEKKFTEMELNAFTVNAYRFRISLNDEVVTDSLLTPEGRVLKDFFFNDYSQRIRVYNTSDETLLIDAPYTLNVGKKSVFTIYQTQADTPPFYLAPSPGEPLPASGNAKLSIICSGESLSDSVRVVVENQDTTIDNVRLKKDNFSRFFEVDASKGNKISFYKIPGNDFLGEVLFSANSFTADFVIYRLVYQGSTSLIEQQLY
jgi:hypothetical protein